MAAPIDSWHVARTLRAMELLAVEPHSAPELAAALGMHVRTARRLLRRLDQDGYIEVTGDHRRRYRPTMRIVALAGQVVARAELTRIAVPHVERLAAQLGLACHLCVPSHLFALCLVHVEGQSASTCRPQLRELVPCHCTAAGKALLAWREPWAEAVLRQPLERFTDRTLTGPQWLRKELARTATRGYSIEDREYVRGTRGVGAPIFSTPPEAVAAIAVVGLTSELPPESHRRIGEAVKLAAEALSAELAE